MGGTAGANVKRKPLQARIVGRIEKCPKPDCACMQDCDPPKKAKFFFNKWSHISDLIDELQNADLVEINLTVIGPPLSPKTRRPVIPYRGQIDKVTKGTLDFQFIKLEDTTDPKSKVRTRARIWEHHWWEYKSPQVVYLPLDDSPRPSEERMKEGERPEERDRRREKERIEREKREALAKDTEAAREEAASLDKASRMQKQSALDRWEADRPGAGGLSWLLPSPYNRHDQEPASSKYGAFTRSSVINEVEESVPTRADASNLEESKHSRVVATEQGFQNVQREASRHIVDLMMEFVGESDPEWLNKHKEDLETIQWWIENWLSIFPTRRMPVFHMKLLLKCPRCKKEWERTVAHNVTQQDTDVIISEGERTKRKEESLRKETKCPRCRELIKPWVANERPWLNVIIELQVDSIREGLPKKREEKYSMTPISVNFHLDKPKQAVDAEAETEQIADERARALETTAKELEEHLRTFKNSKVEPHLVIRGYTDISGSCEYNLDLSKRRAQWMLDELQKRGVNLPKSITLKGCGKRFADDKYPEKERYKDRKVIIQLYEEPSEKRKST